MSRVHTMARFDDRVPEPSEVGRLCDYCEEPFVVGDEVTETHDFDIVHDDCWRGHCDEVYKAKSGEINEKGAVI